ncbi:MAG: hypothetical protein U1E26_04210 [Coriobacteriia bacterium]|nr:hypothetical protein [Coriobacteriia bacterium]
MRLEIRHSRMMVAAVLVGVLVASMVLMSVSAPDTGMTGAGKALGQAGFAYASGLRRFAAAVLWNRLEPLFHDYYEDTVLTDQLYMLPTIRMVTMLDPQFQQGYFVSAWIVRSRMGEEQGIAVARDGLVNNPQAGLMHANLLQLLMLADKDAYRPEIARLTYLIVGDSVEWHDEEERFEGLAIARDSLLSLGDDARAQAVATELARLRAEGIGLGDHDHDGDGKQDH